MPNAHSFILPKKIQLIQMKNRSNFIDNLEKLDIDQGLLRALEKIKID